MKISKSALTIAAAMAVASPTPALATTNGGPVLGNIDSVQEMSPQVVLPYLAHCAGVAESNAPAGSDCLFKAYITQQFPDPTWGNDMCSPPAVSPEEINSNLQVAANQCSDFTDVSYLETASESLMKVFSMDSCWADLCEQDSIVPRLEADYIETCADVDLPYPGDETMFLTDDDQQDAVLTCMLQYIMETPASTFGFDGPASSCYPPGYQEMNDVCHEFLAVQAFEQCIDLASSSMVWDDQIMMSMSFDYDMSMKMEPEEVDDMEAHTHLLDRFCEILEALSTERGRKCLDEICDYDMDPEPSSVPTAEPTPMPSSPVPSTAPTAEPSDTPSDPPTPPYLRPPSAAPSVSPSVMPTVDDTDVITNPEVVSSAPLVSTVIILGCSSWIMFLIML